jgi:hypothetical protein
LKTQYQWWLFALGCLKRNGNGDYSHGESWKTISVVSLMYNSFIKNTATTDTRTNYFELHFGCPKRMRDALHEAFPSRVYSNHE